MSNTERKLRVFLCHASQDKSVVRELYQQLLAEGWIDPWLDEEKLLPGQDWDLEIEKAVEIADVVIVFISKNSVTKEGYIQRELRLTLNMAEQKPEGTIFVVPLRLDNCEPPRRLRMWQYIDYFSGVNINISYLRLLKSLKSRNTTLNEPLIQSRGESTKKKDYITQTIPKVKRYPKRIIRPIKYDKNNIRIGIWGSAGVGKTAYLLSLYISARQSGSEWLVGFDEYTPKGMRESFMESAFAMLKGRWPMPNSLRVEPDSYGMIFYPSPEKSELKDTKNGFVSSVLKFFTEEPDLIKKKPGLLVYINDVAGEEYILEPVESPLWQYMSGCNGIICLIDPSNLDEQLQNLNKLGELLYLKTKKEMPDALINGRYLPHYISVCFTKMDRPEWRSMLDSPTDVLITIEELTGISLQRQLWISFLPDRVNFYCISSVGLEYEKTGKIKPINVLAPFNDWIAI